MDWLPINWGLMKNPLNWVIVGLVVLVAAFAAYQVAALTGTPVNGSE